MNALHQIESAESERSEPANVAPPLPIERHIVGAALCAERMRQLTEQLLLLLRHAPRDAETYARVHNDILDAWSVTDQHFQAYHAVIGCGGQA
ncbi:hypothetical protein DWF00_16600 [Bosea caraganae]|uniref:Uncharacterized protein n=1 Tax=Bosea caraganae TaxID=2763117 RepID=A0A370KYP4_9HYPH|nr:hypothetical protein [Bosea caraganae]RDJ20129.1 hypothetical protein DWE98_26205 [Bosea caraganae]RDJ24841.1 hypothetical protein DWF00_16600 [Bosea caraganae]